MTLSLGRILRQPRLARLEEHSEPFLCEVVVVGQDFVDSQASHRQHRDAIRQLVNATQ